MPPSPNRLILPSTPHPRPIRTPVHRKHLILMPDQILLHLPRRHIPDLARRILGRADLNLA